MWNHFRLNLTLSLLLAAAFGTLIGWIDLKSAEVQPVVLLILISTAILGFVQPQRAWLSALMIGGSILAAHLIGPLVGVNPPYVVEPNGLATLMALIPAFIGAYIGAFISWSVPKRHEGL